MTDLLQGSELVAADGRTVRLGGRLGQGGEGTVFELEGEPLLVAKIYRGPLSPERVDKIGAMIRQRSASMDAVTAWPVELLALPTGEPIGLSMVRVRDAADIHQLYSPKSRRAAFPLADWRFLVAVAAELSRAVAIVHDASAVIADVNHSGVLVDQGAHVRLIDCDSFQIEADGRCFLCDVGVSTFTPPELQGQSFAGLARTPDHDNFGLAVLVFLLLFMGRHPFAGRFSGEGDMTIERAIAEHRFAFGEERRAVDMEPPPGAPPLAIASPPIAALFERAFAANATGSKGRPTARDWATALDRLHGELAPCSGNGAHWHWQGLAHCPWCAMEAATGVPLFSDALSPATAGLFDFGDFWKQVLAVEHPGPAPAIESSERIAVSDDVRKLRTRRLAATPIALLVAAAPVGLIFAIDAPGLAAIITAVCAVPLFVVTRSVLRSAGDTSSFLHWVLHCRAEWDTARREWETKAGPAAFDAKRQELDALRAEWEVGTKPEARQDVEVRLRRALGELLQARNQIEFARTSLRERCEEAHRHWLQSEADLRAVG
jgi:DNA-binding helix-hairpin-helix protein with protein kinase domain